MNYPILKAKRNVFAALSDKSSDVNIGTSTWYLGRRRPAEFGPKVSISTAPEDEEQIDEKRKAILDQYLNSKKK